jgi:hypothetical protein
VGWVLALIIIGIGIRNCSYVVSTYDNINHPILGMFNYGADPDDFFVWTIFNRGNEDATNIHFKFAGIDSAKKSATPLKPESPSLWPRLLKDSKNTGEVRIQVNRSKYLYLPVCIDYMSERGQQFAEDGDFYDVGSWLPGMSLATPPRPKLSEGDELRAEFPCAKL